MSAISVSSASTTFILTAPPATTRRRHRRRRSSNRNPNHHPAPPPPPSNNIRTTTLGRPQALDTFFFWPPSASSFTSSSLSTNNTTTSDNTSRYSTDSDITMPASTFAAPERPAISPSTTSLGFYTNSTYCVANTTVNTSQWRPQSARSGRSNRSPSPLFARWARRNHHQTQPLDTRPKTESQGGSSSNNKTKPRRHTHTRSGNLTRTASVQKRQSHAGLPPPLTREEFEGLPIAIQRKYFSTLERLRFAQDSGTDRISQHYNEISSQNFKRRKPRQSRSASHFPTSQITAADSLAFANLPDKIKRKLFTGEEQVALERSPRTSVVLDAADEAVYKFGRKAGKHIPPALELRSPTVSSRAASMDLPTRSPGISAGPNTNGSTVPDSFYESFRWLEEEDNLDLRLFLDDYHANLRDNVPSSPTTQHRPSFRRHLSISKIPFGRSSVSTSRPATKDGMISPLSMTHSPTSPQAAGPAHGRRKSRALSLITPKYTPQVSPSAIDPDAAHYQDPEARLKLRVYLASPQKFDEAVEFGFPSTDVLSSPPEITKESIGLGTRQTRQKPSVNSLNLRSFLADDDEDDADEDADKLSLNSDQPSVADPESPKTPQPYEKPATRPHRVSTDPIHMHVSKLSDASYVQAPVSSREMTLRMTLTRPDLRANEDQIYGWQKPGHQAGKRSQTSHLRDDSTVNVSYLGGEGSRKESIEKVLAGIDHWNASEADNSVMKRIWNRVRRS